MGYSWCNIKLLSIITIHPHPLVLVKQAVQTVLWVRLLGGRQPSWFPLRERFCGVGSGPGVWALVMLHQRLPEPGVCGGMALPADPADKCRVTLYCNEHLDTRLESHSTWKEWSCYFMYSCWCLPVPFVCVYLFLLAAGLILAHNTFLHIILLSSRKL